MQRHQVMCAHLSEREKRIWAASEAITIGRGGDTIVSEATGISRVTISKGKKEVKGEVVISSGRIREAGGGRKRLIKKHPKKQFIHYCKKWDIACSQTEK